MNQGIKIVLFVLGIALIGACTDPPAKKLETKKTESKTVAVPVFNADSAYHYIKQQVEFGPRVPGTEAHSACAKYFVDYFNQLGLKVYEQDFKARSFNGKILNGKNIIASINPEDSRRILLSAHWDSRPFADHDIDPEKHYTPIDGANDGGSGVGVLMEIARQLSLQKPEIGIDIILFDLEDYGQHAGEEQSAGSENSWALGSQYWAKNPHIPGYDARYGILLDMVGAEGAVFKREYYSNQYAPGVLTKVWNIAASIGYANYFLNQDGGAVLDDHVFINKFAYIPTIDIIHYDAATGSGFFSHWHTVEDNLDKIDKFSLKVVGQTVTEVVYRER